jgi:hypothetical protein
VKGKNPAISQQMKLNNTWLFNDRNYNLPWKYITRKKVLCIKVSMGRAINIVWTGQPIPAAVWCKKRMIHFMNSTWSNFSVFICEGTCATTDWSRIYGNVPQQTGPASMESYFKVWSENSWSHKSSFDSRTPETGMPQHRNTRRGVLWNRTSVPWIRIAYLTPRYARYNTVRVTYGPKFALWPALARSDITSFHARCSQQSSFLLTKTKPFYSVFSIVLSRWLPAHHTINSRAARGH